MGLLDFILIPVGWGTDPLLAVPMIAAVALMPRSRWKPAVLCAVALIVALCLTAAGWNDPLPNFGGALTDGLIVSGVVALARLAKRRSRPAVAP